MYHFDCTTASHCTCITARFVVFHYLSCIALGYWAVFSNPAVHLFSCKRVTIKLSWVESFVSWERDTAHICCWVPCCDQCSNAAGGVRTALSRKPAARGDCGRIMGQTDGQMQDHVIRSAPYRPIIRPVPIIEEKPVDTIFVLRHNTIPSPTAYVTSSHQSFMDVPYIIWFNTQNCSTDHTNKNPQNVQKHTTNTI